MMAKAVRFKVDENLPRQCTSILVAAGFEADSVGDEDLVGTPDSTIIKTCIAESRTLLTADLGFADIRHYPPGEHHGIIVFRVSPGKHATMKALRRTIPLFARMNPHGQLWIVEDNRLRIRD